MEQIVEKYGWKKVAIVLVGIGVLGVVFVLLSFSSLDREAMEIAKKNSGDTTTQTTVRRVDPFSRGGGSGLSEYKTNYYTVSVPDYFKEESFNAGSGILHTVKFTDDVTEAIISIVVFPASSNTIASLALAYENNQFTKSEVSFSDRQIVEYNKAQEASTKQKIAFINKGNTIIRFNASYEQSKTDDSMENIFSHVLETLK